MYDDIKITARTHDGLHPKPVGSVLGRIVCPHCGMEQVHLRRVEVGAREEDREARVVRIHAQSGEVRQAHRPADKCVGRRDWVMLSFDCEAGCEFTISLAQHKGDTFVSVLEEERFARIDQP